MRTAVQAAAGAIALCLAAACFGQSYGSPGLGRGPETQGPASGPGKGPAGPQGPRAPSFGSGNTYGWSMMTRQERDDFRSEMLAAKNLEQCQAAVSKHRQAIEARAKERGAAVPRGPRTDMCQVMQRRGLFGS